VFVHGTCDCNNLIPSPYHPLGLVYDISNGQVSGLGTSVGPPGFPLQSLPDLTVKRHVDSVGRDHSIKCTVDRHYRVQGVAHLFK
jgi:hypothetical protein